MTAEIVVVRPGISTTVQDLGRPGYRALGVPPSGALDEESLRLANAVVGNPADTPALEMLYSGITFEVRGGSMRCALAGARATVSCTRSAAPSTLPAWQSCTLQAGDRLRVEPSKETALCYLAIEGGFDIAPVMGSCSTYARAGFGGWQGRALRAGDVLPLAQASAPRRGERRLAVTPPFGAPDTLRVLLGPHDARFKPASIDAFFAHDFGIGSASDRSGLRLEGPPLEHVEGYDLDSEGIAPGSIQVPGSGLPVMLLADQPTVGGYPRIATVIAADMAASGRLRIGSRVRFRRVNESEAREARHALTALRRTLAASIATA